MDFGSSDHLRQSFSVAIIDQCLFDIDDHVDRSEEQNEHSCHSALYVFSLLLCRVSQFELTSLLCLASNNEVQLDRRTVFRNVLNENREMITRPAITLIPSIFSLFSLPFLIISFSLGCQNLADDPIRYVLIVFYFVTFVPPMLMFVLYIYPSSFYWKEWESTRIGQRLNVLRQGQSLRHVTSLHSRIKVLKARGLSSLTHREWKICK